MTELQQPSGEVTLPEVHRCRGCGTLWHRWEDGSWSWVSNCRPDPLCCGNTKQGEHIEQLWPANEAMKRVKEILGDLTLSLAVRVDRAYDLARRASLTPTEGQE